jgi:hypothetical protein
LIAKTVLIIEKRSGKTSVGIMDTSLTEQQCLIAQDTKNLGAKTME